MSEHLQHAKDRTARQTVLDGECASRFAAVLDCAMHCEPQRAARTTAVLMVAPAGCHRRHRVRMSLAVESAWYKHEGLEDIREAGRNTIILCGCVL